MSALMKAWHGEERLWKVFWLYTVLGSFLILFLLQFLQAVGLSAEKNGHSTTWILVLIGLLTIFLLAYSVWTITSLWKCAFNVSWKGWGYLGRAYVIWCVFVILLMLFNVAKLAV